MTHRVRAVAGAALAASVLLTAAAPAAAAGGPEVRRLCADRAVLRDAPAGFAVAHLRRPQRLRVHGRAQRGRWAYVTAIRTGATGWMPSAGLCRAR